MCIDKFELIYFCEIELLNEYLTNSVKTVDARAVSGTLNNYS